MFKYCGLVFLYFNVHITNIYSVLHMVINSFMFLTYIYPLYLCAITKEVLGTTAVNCRKVKLLFNFNFFFQ